MENLFGRRKLHTVVANITEANVLDVLNDVLSGHMKNMVEEDYLYWYRRGLQPVLEKTKEVRTEINNKITENDASKFVAFKNGYFLTKPVFYVSRREDITLTDDIVRLNDYLYMSGKQDADNTIVDWFHTVGLGVLYVESNADAEAPVRAYALDPRNAFVVYSMMPGEEPVMGVNMTLVGEGNDGTISVVYDVYTKENIFRISGGMTSRRNAEEVIPNATANSVESVEYNAIGEIPIIEYSYNSSRQGSFEMVVPILDAINNAQSVRADSEEQFVNSLLVFYNCQLGEDDNGNPVTPQMVRASGAIFLKSVGQDKADVKEIGSVLEQTQSQVYVDDLRKQACDIAGVPFTTETSAGTSDNVGAVYLRNGWGTADTMARNTEDLFRKANRYFDRIFLKILASKSLIVLRVSDVDIQFTRNEMDNLLVKVNAANQMKAFGLAPEICLAKSGLSEDPIGDVERSRKYIDASYSVAEPKEESKEESEEDLQDDEGTDSND